LVVGELLPGTPLAWVREGRERGKHRTEVTEVTEGDIGVGGGIFAGGTPLAWVREARERGKHRTEATEVTEGDIEVGGGNFCRGHRWPGCENHALGEGITQIKRE
jgi:hypothetical protein